ncbi:MAG: peptidoglycan-binding protein, partial [Gammaproteobacteria bacterium]|nr:peptidoglycan-binding protein [Gammaproteobacteria bacterium]
MQTTRLASRRGHALAFVLISLLWPRGAAMAADVPLWFDGARPGPQALQAVELLAAAASHGLEPRDYAARILQEAVERASDGAPLMPDEAARLDQALTATMQRYLADLHGGRIEPRHIYQRFMPVRREPFDPAVALRMALAQRRLPEAVAEAEPQLPMYGHLREALARYRSWADHPAWREALPPLPAGRGVATAKLEPGQAWDGLALLTQRLVLLGDLAPDTPPPASYEARLVDAVKLFQQRHGLATDGVIGRATLAQL